MTLPKLDIRILRDGASVRNSTYTSVITGAAVTEMFSTQRYVALSPPVPTIIMHPGSIYRVYTGLGVDTRDTAYGLDLRPISSVFNESGMDVVRIDVLDQTLELVVYVTVRKSYTFNRSVPLLESYTLAKYTHNVIESEIENVTAPGFVPTPTRTVVEKPRPQTPAPAQSDNSEAARAAQMAKWLESADAPVILEQSAPPNITLNTHRPEVKFT